MRDASLRANLLGVRLLGVRLPEGLFQPWDKGRRRWRGDEVPRSGAG